MENFFTYKKFSINSSVPELKCAQPVSDVFGFRWFGASGSRAEVACTSSHLTPVTATCTASRNSGLGCSLHTGSDSREVQNRSERKRSPNLLPNQRPRPARSD